LFIPPPREEAVLPVKVQLVTTGDEEVLYIPPPEFPVKIQSVTVGEEEEELSIPPPEFPVKLQLVTVGDEEVLYIPRPEFPAKVQLVTIGDEEVLYIPSVPCATVNPSSMESLAPRTHWRCSSPSILVTLAAQSRCSRAVSVPLKPP
jgi:hypothetical protein